MRRPLSLQELKNLKPKDLYIEHPNLDPLWRDHLLWLLDNHPGRCLELFRRDRKQLALQLLRALQRASLYDAILREEKYYEKDQIQEFVYGKIVAPSDSLREPVNPISDKMRLKILAWSDNLNLKDSESL
jgi:hypothetical protein